MVAASQRPARLNARRVLAAAAVGLALTAGAAAADSYLGAVRSAERALAAPGLSSAAVQRIRSRLLAGTTCSQPEIDADLTVKPPDVADARQRLASLDQALTAAPQPRAGVEAKLRSLATSGTYDREQPESPGDLLQGGFQSLEAKLAGAACGGGLAIVLLILKWVAVVVAAAVLAILLWRLLRRYRRRDPAEAGGERQPDHLRTAADRFAAADRLAAEGDLAGAMRELASAVATVLGGEAAWDLSPLTVREIFLAAGKLPDLRPLLLGFEEAVYGHREVTRERYDTAAAAAAPFRPAARRAA